jgi:hypothetical protein
MTENMMSQSVRHESEILKLRESETDALKRLNELLIEKDGDLGKAQKKEKQVALIASLSLLLFSVFVFTDVVFNGG